MTEVWGNYITCLLLRDVSDLIPGALHSVHDCHLVRRPRTAGWANCSPARVLGSISSLALLW